MYTGLFEQVKRPGGAVAGGGEGLHKRLDPGPRKGSVRGKDAKVLYTSFFEQVWRSGGTVSSGVGASDRGRIEKGSRRPRLGRDQRPGDRCFRTVAAVPEEPLAVIEKESVQIRVRGSQNQRFGRKPAGKAECRVDGRETSSAVRSEQRPWERRASQRSIHAWWFWRKPPRLESLRVRNSSGSLTA